jgi:hypothetical protein
MAATLGWVLLVHRAVALDVSTRALVAGGALLGALTGLLAMTVLDPAVFAFFPALELTLKGGVAGIAAAAARRLRCVSVLPDTHPVFDREPAT